MKRLQLFPLFVILALLIMSGCHSIECGEGTVEKDGVCVTLNFPDTDGGIEECPFGTYLNETTGECFIDPNLVCGPGTEVVWNEDNTEFFCQSKGAPDLPECPPPGTDGTICINGKVTYLIDPDSPDKFLETTITDASLLATLEIVVYDPLDYAADGDASVPLGTATIDPVTNGFIATNIAIPSQGYVALVVRDTGWQTADSTPVNWLFTGHAYRASAGQNLENVLAISIRADQLDQWHAELPAGYLEASANCSENDIYRCGTWIGIYNHNTGDEHLPVGGVRPYYQTNSPIPEADIAFLDTNSSGEYVVLTPGTERRYTSDTGVAMYFGAELTNYYGSCDLMLSDSTCTEWGMDFPSTTLQGGASPGAIFVQYVDGQRLN